MSNNMKMIFEEVYVLDPLNGKAPPFVPSVPGEELDVGQVRDLTDEELIELGITVMKHKCPVFLYWYDNQFSVGEMSSRRFDSKEDVKLFFENTNHLSLGGRFHTVKNVYVIRYKEFPYDYDNELSELTINFADSFRKLANKLKSSYEYGDREIFLKEIISKLNSKKNDD